MLILPAVLMVLVDVFYLSSVSKYFNKQISDIQNTPIKLDMPAAILCYIFLVGGLYYFVIKDRKPVFDAFILGLVIYMVYETTNKAILTNWKWETVLLDGLWGGILFSLTTYLTYKLVDYYYE